MKRTNYCYLLKGELHPKPKIRMHFELYLKIIDILLKNNIYMHLIVNCPRNSKMALNLSRPNGSWVIDQNITKTVLIHNLKAVAYQLGGMGGQCPGAPELKGPLRERDQKKKRKKKKKMKKREKRKERKEKREQNFLNTWMGPRDLARIWKLPVLWEKLPVLLFWLKLITNV